MRKTWDNISSPSAFETASALFVEAGQDLLAQLQWMTLQPKVILEAGCKTGQLTGLLQKYYPKAQLLAMENAEIFLMHAKENTAPGQHWVCAEAKHLPLLAESVDLIFANLCLPWEADMQPLLQEWRRVLRPHGLLLFSALGPDTLKEYRADLAHDFLPQLLDMHDLGDSLLQQGFVDPVLEVNDYTLVYSHPEKLRTELSASGFWLPSNKTEIELLPAADGTWPVTCEMIIGHAFKPEPQEKQANQDSEIKIPLSQLRQMLRRS